MFIWLNAGTLAVVERPKEWNETAEGGPAQVGKSEDIDLIKGAKAGKSEAFGALIVKYQDRVYNAVWRISGNAEDARDLTQEAFLKALQRISSFREDSGFYTWIFRIAVNLALTARRSQKVRRTVALDESQDLSTTQAVGLMRYTDEVPEDRHLQEKLLEAMQSLDDDQRAVVVLRDIEDMNYQTIGEILEVPVGTVKSRLHRGRMALREALGPMLGDKHRQEGD